MKLLGFLCLFAILASTLTLAKTNPVPLINQPLVPDARKPGGAGFTLRVNGTGFVSSSVVNWNGRPRTTTFVSDSELKAIILASDVAKDSTASVTVFNPRPGGGTSNVAFFPIALPIPSIWVSRTDYAVTATPWGVTVGDFNDDGNLDLAVANSGGSTVSILLGIGDGTFHPPLDYSTGSAPVNVATGDFNGDGKLDLAVANDNSNDVSVLLGNGDGTFQAHIEYSTGSTPRTPVTGDFNGDGTLDLAVANYGDNTVSVLLGNGDGTFRSQVTYPVGPQPGWLVTGDFNNDGRLDLATANFDNFSGRTVSVLLGNGDGTFQSSKDYATGTGPASITTADFSGDGELDLATGDSSGVLSVLLGDGDGTFQPPANYDAGTGANGAASADFNGDGKLDLAVSSAGNLQDFTVSILLGNGNGTFQAQTFYPTSSGPRQIAVGDFNGDGRLDLAVAGSNVNAISVFLEAATVAVSPPSLHFGVQVVGSRSLAQKAVLTNIGTTTLHISSIAITGIDTGDFGEHNNCGSSLPPKAHCTISVTFKPTQLGPRTAAVTITDDAPGNPQSVPLGGIGATSGPNATLSTESLNFPIQVVGTASPAHPVTLSNYGTMTLDINSIVASGDFGETHNCGSTLEPGAHCTISVTFTPTQRGHRIGTVTIMDNAPDSPQEVSLKGTATVVKLDPASLDFGSVNVGQQSSPQNTTLTNVGKTRLHITDITITGTDSGDFSEQNNCPDPGYLGGGNSCTITVTFQPTQVGSRSAYVSVSDHGGGSPQQVSLSGIGQQACSGPCTILCRVHHCGCSNGLCVPGSVAAVEETASRLTCSQTNPFTELR
jgi:hypothetical protein